MNSIRYKSPEQCRYDAAALGEVMLRLDPGDTRIHTARQFSVCEGGGEYNVARGLRRCFGLRTTVLTALVDNPVGRLVEDLMLQGGVDLSHVLWRPFDGVGTACRNGLNFTERGFGVRGARGCSDRGHTAIAQITPDDFDFETLFAHEHVRHLHTGGIFAALGPQTAQTALKAIQCARKNGTICSYDLNFRASLWKENGGSERARQINTEIARELDILIGNEEDYSASLGFTIPGTDASLNALPVEGYKIMLQNVFAAYPQLKLAAVTLRSVKTASCNDWHALAFDGTTFYESPRYDNLEIFDRVGGGDSFASGLIYGLLSGKSIADALACGVAHGALAMTTPGDNSMATCAEVEKLMRGAGARVDR